MAIYAFSIVQKINDGNDVQMIEYSSADMKGYIPASLINMTLGSIMQQEYTDMAIMLNDIKAGKPM
jgi:hypothetical protein